MLYYPLSSARILIVHGVHITHTHTSSVARRSSSFEHVCSTQLSAQAQPDKDMVNGIEHVRLIVTNTRTCTHRTQSLGKCCWCCCCRLSLRLFQSYIQNERACVCRAVSAAGRPKMPAKTMRARVRWRWPTEDATSLTHATAANVYNI